MPHRTHDCRLPSSPSGTAWLFLTCFSLPLRQYTGYTHCGGTSHTYRNTVTERRFTVTTTRARGNVLCPAALLAAPFDLVRRTSCRDLGDRLPQLDDAQMVRGLFDPNHVAPIRLLRLDPLRIGRRAMARVKTRIKWTRSEE